jgi:hypothetical protein
MSNINTNTVNLMNAGGKQRCYQDVPDLWHIAMYIEELVLDHPGLEGASAKILDTWHQCHDYKDAITEDRGAKIISIT